MQDFPHDKIHSLICHECKPLHADIIEQLLKRLEDPQTHKTHFFNGRYENIYIDKTHLPTIEPILNTILEESARLLRCDKAELKMGFWFNLMQKDDVTLAHNHDDDDEIISGTYYLQVPEHSGILNIKLSEQTKSTIKPNEARLTFFHPAVEHEVSKHHSPIPRISIGFNIGSKISEHALPDKSLS